MNILLRYSTRSLPIKQINTYQRPNNISITPNSNENIKLNNHEIASNTTKKLYCPEPVMPDICCPDPNIPTLCCPPLKILHNFKTGTCWIISLLHNIRANIPLKNFILKNCREEKFVNELENLVNIENHEITPDQWNLMTSFYPSGIVWGTGGDPILLIESIFKYISCQQSGDLSAFHSSNARDFGNKKPKCNSICPIYKYRSIPYYTIYTAIWPMQGYINVENVLRGRPNDETTDTVEDLNVFDTAEDFMILHMDKVYTISQKYNKKGIVIQKDIHIKVKGEKEMQKYSLTGILLSEIIQNSKGHGRAYIKGGYKWYDTDFEMVKRRTSPTQESTYTFFLELKNQFTDAITIEYSTPNCFNVYAVFYQRVV